LTPHPLTSNRQGVSKHRAMGDWASFHYMEKYNLKSIFQQIVEVTNNIEKFTIEELWKWTVFDNENEDLNNLLQIHIPSGVATCERKNLLPESKTIMGDYLLFEYIAHQPSFSIRQFNDVGKLAQTILSDSGILNPFTTIQLPIVKGQLKNILAILKHKKTDFTDQSKETKLLNEILTLSDKINKMNFQEKISEGRDCVVKYKLQGGTQQKAYDTIFAIYLVYQELDNDSVSDWVADIMDCIVGFVGNKNWCVWDKYL
jgi:hypothetical protein